jgi:hypothetical protein
MIVALSAPALADSIRAITGSLAFTSGPVTADLARVDEAEVRVSSALAAAIARRLAEVATPAPRAQLALAALAEIARAIADPIRARAQRRLAAATRAEQAAALARDVAEPAAAPIITAAVADLVASGGVDDQGV